VAPLDRLERLTDLVLVLLDAPRPMTLEEIAGEVPGYPDGHDARRQAFERDKRLLRDEGIPVLTEPVGGTEQYGYRIEPGALYLTDLELDRDEQAALHLAVAAVDLGDPSGRDALLKLGASGIAEARTVAALVPPASLVPLFEALRSRSEVSFSYRGERRTVAPGGLRFRHGWWYLVGWDRTRSAARTFRVDRMGDRPEVGPAGSGALPEGFDPASAAPEHPWRRSGDGGEDVMVLVDHIEAGRVTEEVGKDAVVERRDDGSVLLRLGVTSEPALRSWILGLLDHAEVFGPPPARQAMIAWLDAIAGGATGGPAPDGPGTPEGDARGREVVAATVGSAGGPAPAPLPALDARRRLRRLLAMVGWLARVREAPIEEVARRFGIDQDQVVAELELAACCGLPPYSPDALLEIVVTDRTVQASLPPDLARPRRLTAAEGLALAAAARAILAVPGADADGALSRALVKLDAALGLRGGLVVDLDAPPLLAAVRRAVDERSRVAIEYHSASADQTTSRIVDPLSVVARDGHWYLDADCQKAGGLRRFRVDRIRSVEVVGPQPDGVAGELSDQRTFVPGPGAVEVRIALGPGARWVVESVPVVSVAADGPGEGWIEATLAVGGTAWLERLLLQLGTEARVLSPPELVGTGPGAARRVLARYRR
jgi:predicted DNA-binding transcriptional regulator YafY